MTAAGRDAQLDHRLLGRAIELSRIPPSGDGNLPFGAVVALGGRVLGEAHNEIASRSDPTAHAEILALRAAGRSLGGPTMEGAVLYSSSEPCPMCLAACYWARIERVVHGAAIGDTAEFGFEDAAYQREMALPATERALRIEPGDKALRTMAIDALRRWSAD